jgi:hypothetical protein
LNVDEITVGGAPAAKFPTIGTMVKGKIVACDEAQATDFDTKKPLTYEDSGKPVMQYIITLQTDQHDPEIEDDDGQRRIFAKGQMRFAFREAVKKSGQKSGTVVGGTLTVLYAEDGEPPRRGANPPKVYKAKYEPPVTGGPFDDEQW